MKLLIAYDGSRCADAALRGLDGAGLPPAADVVVLSVLERWMPPPSMQEIVGAGASTQLGLSLHEIDRMAAEAVAMLRARFPSWTVRAKTIVGVPARAILDEATSSRADLVVLGSEGHTALGRYFVGSVSHKVAIEAPCSVRIVRPDVTKSDRPLRIIIGFKPAPSGEEAIRAVAARRWPPGTQVRLVTAVDALTSFPADAVRRDELDQALTDATAQFDAIGLVATSVVHEGDPRKIVVDEAERWGADAIFVGTRDLTRVGRWSLGSVSGAILTRAHCTVEIVRQPGW